MLDSGLLLGWQGWQNSIVVNKEEQADPKVKQRGMQKGWRVILQRKQEQEVYINEVVAD